MLHGVRQTRLRVADNAATKSALFLGAPIFPSPFKGTNPRRHKNFTSFMKVLISCETIISWSISVQIIEQICLLVHSLTLLVGDRKLSWSKKSWNMFHSCVWNVNVSINKYFIDFDIFVSWYKYLAVHSYRKSHSWFRAVRNRLKYPD